MTEFLRSARSPFAATPLIAVASLASLWALTRMVHLGAWIGTTAFALGVVTLVIVLTRLVSRSRYLPTFMGLIAATWILLPLYVLTESGQRALLPTPANLQGLAIMVSDGIAYAEATIAPAPVGRVLAGVLTAGILGLFLLAEHIAVSWRAVASSGLILILPWLPAVILQHRVSTTVLLVAIGAWVLAMALSRTNAPVERGISAGSAVTATAAALLLTTMAVPAAFGDAAWGAIPRFDTPPGFETATRLNLELDLRTSLTTNSRTPVIAYVTSGPRPDAFRLYTVTDFNGSGWGAERQEVTTPRPATGGVLWPESVEGWTSSERVRLDVRVLSLIETNLPIPAVPRTVEVEGDWNYDPIRDEVVATGRTTENLQYAIVADFTYHDADSLRASQDLLESNRDHDETNPIYLDVAPAIDLNRIRTLAEQLTATSETRYDAAVAIQSYLRSPTNFTYDTAVSPTGGDGVSSFLDDRSGFCVQFATTMVVMLRSIGIPARLAVGFLPGRYDDDNRYIIQGSDAHAWPEVYFPGQGWVRFEPTPSVQTGAPPQYADPFANQIPVPRAVLEGGGYPTGPSVIPLDPNAQPPVVVVDQTAPGLPLWLIIVFAILGVGVGLGVFTLWRRGGSFTLRSLHGPEATWQRLRERLGELGWPDSFTPLEARAHVLRNLRIATGHPVGVETAAALDGLGDAVSDHRYAPWGTDHPQPQLEAWANQIISEAAEATTEAKGRRSRGDARSALRAGS